MRDPVRETLCQIIAEYGVDVCRDPVRCFGLILDLIPEKRSRNLLWLGLQEQVVAALLEAPVNMPLALVVPRLRQRLMDDHGMTEVAALWMVETWAVALGRMPLPVVEPAAGSIRNNPWDGAEMVYIPSGEFLMGSAVEEIEALLRSNTNYKREWFSDEIPCHTVTLDGYYIYRTPVTVKRYLSFCAASGHRKPNEPGWGWQEDHPVVNVSWEDAAAYCAWQSQQTGLAVSLPTEAQWEKAARGTDGRQFPWGNLWDENKLRCSRAGWGDAGRTSAVGSYVSGASPYGALDMSGNVWEWCSDWFDENYYKTSPNQNPPGPLLSPIGYRVLRGGSWINNDTALFRCANRSRNSLDFRNYIIGFRCVVHANTY